MSKSLTFIVPWNNAMFQSSGQKSSFLKKIKIIVLIVGEIRHQRTNLIGKTQEMVTKAHSKPPIHPRDHNTHLMCSQRGVARTEAKICCII